MAASHREGGRPGSSGDARPEVTDVEQAGPLRTAAARVGMNMGQEIATRQEDVFQTDEEGKEGSLPRAIRSPPGVSREERERHELTDRYTHTIQSMVQPRRECTRQT